MSATLFETYMSFGKWLARKRFDARLTQDQLAKKAGVSVSYISALEREEPNTKDGQPRLPRLDKIDAIAAALRIPADEARAVAYGGAEPNRPRTVEEFLTAIESLGIDHIEIIGGTAMYTEEHLQKLLDDVRLVIRLNLLQALRPPERHFETDFSDDPGVETGQINSPDNVRSLPPKRTRRA